MSEGRIVNKISPHRGETGEMAEKNVTKLHNIKPPLKNKARKIPYFRYATKFQHTTYASMESTSMLLGTNRNGTQFFALEACL